jgi:two-component system, NarL family, response regulator LiaR
MTTAQEAITVLIVDDHALVREGVERFLHTQDDIAVVASVSSGAEALHLVGELVPEVVLMDLVMPEMDGVETTRRLKQISPTTQVIVLTSYHEDAHIFPAIRAGALSYLLKDVSAHELGEAIRKAARGEALLHPQVAARLVADMQGATVNPWLDLSAREVEVLRLIAEGASNSAIASRLVISEKTVKTHVRNILSKLQVQDRVQAAAYAWREGVMQRHQP